MRRVAIFTHDTFGLGHVRRCLHIARALVEGEPPATVLLITGCPAVAALGAPPRGADIVKIPTVVKTGAPEHRPPHLSLPLAETTALRARLVREAVSGLEADVFLVDNFPLGSRDELLPVLRALRRRRTRTVLGLRDILGAPEVVRREWRRQGVYQILERYYDRILVYGLPSVLDVAEAYDLPSPVASRVDYCGYITAEDPSPPDGAPPAEIGEGPFLLATGGGGGDAFPLLEAFVEALPLLPDLPTLIVTGPLMSPVQREELASRVDGRRDVTIRDYVPGLRTHIAAAAAVVSMCGYNTAAELMATGTPAVVVPRTWRYGEHARKKAAGEEWEQLMRARALSAGGVVELLEPDELEPERLAERVRAVLARGRRTGGPPAGLDGLAAVRERLLELAESGGRPRPADRVRAAGPGEVGSLHPTVEFARGGPR